MEKMFVMHPVPAYTVHHPVRVLVDGTKVYFGAVDAAAALGFGNPRSAISRYCPEEEIVLIRSVDANRHLQYTKYVDYDTLRDFALASHRDECTAFLLWIDNTVYPILEAKTGLALRRGRAGSRDDLLDELLELTGQVDRLCRKLDDMPMCRKHCCM